MNLRPSSGEEPELNLTSLIDVVLLLLIFFMVSTTFVDESRIEIQLPQASTETPPERTNEPIEIAERIVMNYYTAKRMLAALQMSVQRHEGAFGVLEINVQKRLQGFRG